MIIFLNRVFVNEIKGFNIFLMICSEQEGTLFLCMVSGKIQSLCDIY